MSLFVVVRLNGDYCSLLKRAGTTSLANKRTLVYKI